MTLTEIFADFLDKKASEEEMIAAMVKAYNGKEYTPEQIKAILAEEGLK